MSFSKARIQRFNEFENDVPAPGAYDPKFDGLVHGPLIGKSERFNDKSISSAECDLLGLSKNKSNVEPNFKTPQFPRKKDITRSCSKTKPRTLIPISDKKLKYKSEHHHADLQVKCSNKDKIIEELEKRIEDVQDEVQTLEFQLEELRRHHVEVEDQHKKDIEIMAKMQQEVVNSHVKKHQDEIKHLQCQLSKISEKEDCNIQITKALEQDLKRQIAMLESELVKRKYANKEKVNSLEAQIDELGTKLEELTESHKCEIHLLEQDKFKLKSRITHLTDEITDCEARLRRTITEGDVKINTMIRETKIAVEEEMRLTVERYKVYLTQVEEERVALDKKLVQKDSEISRLLEILEELKSSAETEESYGQSLQMELDKTETELAQKKEELRILKDQIESEEAEMVSRKMRFEVIMAENQASVAALTQHLAQNNSEVEWLTHELKRSEDYINKHCDLLSIMRKNSQMVHVEVHASMEQLHVKKGLIDQLETKSLNEVESIKSIFEAKIRDLKQVIMKKVTLQVQVQLEAECDKKDAQNAELKHQLYEKANHLNKVEDLLLKLEEKNLAQESAIAQYELLNSKLNDQLEARNATIETNQGAKQTIALHEADIKVQELSDKIKDFEERDSVLQDMTKLFDEEKARRVAAEEEVKKLLEYNDRLAKDYQEISEKYAELIGHQNHRQRIKHVSQLKDKINHLEEDLRVKIRTIRKQQQIIEKLKTEEKCIFSKGKENILGLPESTYTTPVSSPHKLLTPLKSRND